MTVSADGPLAPFDRGPSEVERSLGWLIAVGGCILLLDQTVFKVGHAQHFAGWWNAAGVLVAGTLILLAIAGRHLPGRVLRVLWAAVPLGYAMLQAGWSLAYAGTDPNAAMPWLWTLEPAALTLLLLVLTPPSAIAVALAIPLLPALSGWLRFGEVPTAIDHVTVLSGQPCAEPPRRVRGPHAVDVARHRTTAVGANQCGDRHRGHQLGADHGGLLLSRLLSRV